MLRRNSELREQHRLCPASATRPGRVDSAPAAGHWAARACLAACVTLLALPTNLTAQQPATPADPAARIAALERELEALKTQVQTQPAGVVPPSLGPTEIEKLIDRRLKERAAEEEAKKKAEAEQKAARGSVVGEDLRLIPTWDGGGLRLKTSDEAFNIHLGGRLMTDGVWWTESPALKQSPNPPARSTLANITGVGPGIGDLQDGFFVRRARVVADGAIYQTVEFKVEFDFENYNSLLFDESYVGARDLPWVDAVRLGQMHVPFGLEAYTSSRFLPLLERSPLFDAFYQEFAPGIFANETFLGERLTAQQMFHRIDYFNQFNGASFGDGKYAFSTRVSGLPVYEADGRSLVHLGLAYQWRKGSPPGDFNNGTVLASAPNPAVTLNTDLVRFRARPGLRDAVGLQGLNTRVVDTGNLIADRVQALNGEFLWYWGPFWAQCEYCVSRAENVDFPASRADTARGDLTYFGGYAQVGCFLTGESRGYDRRFGKYARVTPLEPFFLVCDENGGTAYGLGAWEVIYRYAAIDLNDDSVQGGRYAEHTVGLNWYWNSNVKLQLNYINGQRAAPAGANSGTVQGLALRAALEF